MVIYLRLLDRILAEGFLSQPEIDQAAVLSQLRRSQLVVIDNVTAYYWQEVERKLENNEKILPSDFPNVRLPFDIAFLEMRLSGETAIESTTEAGVLLRMFDSLQFKLSFPNEAKQLWIQGSSEHARLETEIAYVLTAALFIRTNYGKKNIHTANFILAVNRNGQIVGDENYVRWIARLMLYGAHNEEDIRSNLNFAAARFLYPTLLALSFMHCRNVKVVEETPPSKLSKKHEKKTGRPLLRYRVLQIDHMKEVLEKEGGASKTGLKRALHICRGHFAHYGQEGKGLLFGKYAGTVWVPMHTRGTKEKGVVIKDYDVK